MNNRKQYFIFAGLKNIAVASNGNRSKINLVLGIVAICREKSSCIAP